MASELHNLVISSIRRGELNQAISTTRENENRVDDLAQSTKDKLTSLFNTTGIRVGRFDTEPERPFFARTLDGHLDTETFDIANFRSFGASLGSALAIELSRGQAKNAKDGFLLTYYYSVELDGDDVEEPEVQRYLGLVFLHRINGVDIDVEELDLKEIEQINLDSLNLGARININSFVESDQDETEKPISFKIGRGSDVRKFFQEFIDCTEPSDSKTDSANLIIALEDVCERLGFTAEETKTATDRLQTYCNGAILHNGAQAEIANLAGFVFGDEEQKQLFIQVAQDDYQLSEYIGLDKAEINKFDDIIVKTNDYRVTIKDSAINQSVFWDPDEESIKLSDLPQEVIDKMNRRFPGE
ncbi:nucleoid-associated protein [Vibrio fluvialis]|nr:nucleoid-associated protein [Vibrio fluvialis]MBY8178952.1 nucleoid-associated protein [Vibrio fluvialis]